MTAPRSVPRQQYMAWVEDQIEEYKAGLSHDELLDLAEEAVERIHVSPDGQIELTELLLRDAVDALLMQRLSIPGFRQWERLCRSDTTRRPTKGTEGAARVAS